MKILKINRKNFKRVAKIVAEAIREEKIIICPTDTVYGLLADATEKKAVEKIFKIKKRPKGKPIPIFVKDIKTAKKLAFIDKKQEEFLKKVWPGKMTAVLKKKNRIKIFGADTKTIGLRIPNYKLVNALLAKLNRPLTGTSANISGKPASTRIKEVIFQFKNEQVPRPDPVGDSRWNRSKREQKIKPDLVLDAGNLPKRKPSKVVDFTGKNVKILRP